MKETDKRSYVLAALMLSMMLAAMDTTIISTSIPRIVAELGGFTRVSWVYSIYLLAQTITIPLYGKFADLFGRKKILLFGTALFLLGSLTSALAWDINSLIFFRGLQGLGAGSIMATVNTIAADIYSVEERARVQGYLSSIWGISAILGPTLGGALSEYASWRWIFFINLPIGMVAMGILHKYFIEVVESHQAKIDYKGAISILIGLSSFFIFILEGGQSWAWDSGISITLLSISLIFALATYKIENKRDYAVMPVRLWKNRTILMINLATIFMGIVMMGPEMYLPTFAQIALGFGAIASGLILATMSLGWPVASSLSGKIYLKIGYRQTALIGVVLLIVSYLLFILFPYPQPLWFLIFDQVLIGFGFGLLSTPTLIGLQSMVDWKQRGMVTGSNLFARNLGQSLGASIIGAIFNHAFTAKLKNAPLHSPEISSNLLKEFHSPDLSVELKEFIKNTMNFSMHQVYIALLIFSIFIFIFMYLVPHRDPNDHSTIQI